MGYEWDFDFVWQYMPAIISAAIVTLKLAAIGILGGTILGVGLSVMRRSRFRLLRVVSAIYIETGLALPLLIILIWFYYCSPLISPYLRFSSFAAASLALIVNLSPFVAETVRSGFATLPNNYAMVAQAIGMNSVQTFIYVTFPLALRRILPALITHYVTTLKLVSVCSVIAVPELIHTSSSIISKEFRPLEVYTTVGFVYLVIVLPFTLLARYVEKAFLVKN